MKLGKEIKDILKLPEVSQVGIVVRDLKKTVAYYERVLGLGPFVLPEIHYTDKHYYGKPVDSEWLMAFCSLGPIELELIQPITRPTIYHDFLAEKGEGIHHLGFDVKDMDVRLADCQRMGIKILQIGRTPYGGFAYLDTAQTGGAICELIQRRARRA